MPQTEGIFPFSFVLFSSAHILQNNAVTDRDRFFQAAPLAHMPVPINNHLDRIPDTYSSYRPCSLIWSFNSNVMWINTYLGSFKSWDLTWCAKKLLQGVHTDIYVSALFSHSQPRACHTLKSTGQLQWKKYWKEHVWIKVFRNIKKLPFLFCSFLIIWLRCWPELFAIKNHSAELELMKV